ncbi:hypothetical protein [Actinacidiphila acididurans]|uniref:Uncharacterized protein n=1 Tax=Actinacidiphila acididurans TaxID=2784346 RepID=A0ABS2TTI7_9ACTN|nr:hypothetical protein [Actinacidiphila acididurans]MBM9506658.1 hypothetical protein [Actinacidiphila acididurans]
MESNRESNQPGAGDTFAQGGLTFHVDATGAVNGTARVTVTLTNPSGTNTTLPTQQGTAAVPTNWTAGSRYQWLPPGPQYTTTASFSTHASTSATATS